MGNRSSNTNKKVDGATMDERVNKNYPANQKKKSDANHSNRQEPQKRSSVDQKSNDTPAGSKPGIPPNQTIVYDETYGHVYYGDFKIDKVNNVTAHDAMRNKMKVGQLIDIGGRLNIVYGGASKEDGSIEMNSGSFNDIINNDPLTGAKGPTGSGIRSRPELITIVKKLVADGRVTEVKNQ